MLCYCNKCGRMVERLKKDLEKPCDYCHNIIRPVPEEYLDDAQICILDDLEQQFIDEYIKSSPEFDQYLFEHRAEDLRNRQAERLALLRSDLAEMEGRARGGRFGIECPYCHATNVRKVSFAGRAVSAGLFGLGSKKIGKQWHCNRCGSDF